MVNVIHIPPASDCLAAMPLGASCGSTHVVRYHAMNNVTACQSWENHAYSHDFNTNN
jgi:hypothetical protein